MTNSNAIITTISPSVSAEMLMTSFQPRSKEGEEKKLEVFASFSIPVAFNSLLDSDLKAYCIRSYCNAVNLLLRDAVKEGKPEFAIPPIASLYAETKREFLITKKDLEAWLDGFAMPIISAAISLKGNLHIDSPKVVKKALAYKEIMLGISSRSIMNQEDIDSAIRVLELVVTASAANGNGNGKEHPYTDNVAQGIERKQGHLNEFLAAGAGKETDDIDF